MAILIVSYNLNKFSKQNMYLTLAHDAWIFINGILAKHRLLSFVGGVLLKGGVCGKIGPQLIEIVETGRARELGHHAWTTSFSGF